MENLVEFFHNLVVHFGLPGLFVRKKAKEYGTCKLAEGPEVSGRQTGGPALVASGRAVGDVHGHDFAPSSRSGRLEIGRHGHLPPSSATACRATTISSFVGMVHTCTRLFAAWMA